MNNLCIGMKAINVTQLPGGSLSHKNKAMDLAGMDGGIDYYYAMGRWKCAGTWGTAHTYFYSPVDQNGDFTRIHCADGVDRYITLALTHSTLTYVRPVIGKIYENGPMYEEGTAGNATGNHIHVEVAEGIQKTKTRNRSLGYYIFRSKRFYYFTMQNELDPTRVFFINDAFSRVISTKGATFKHCESVEYKAEEGRDMHLKIHTFKNQAIRKGPSTKDAFLGWIPAGNTEAVVIGVTPRKTDGFQYWKVKYRGIEGYCQGDVSWFEVLED